MPCEDSERNVDEKECKDCRPDCDAVYEFLINVLEHSVKVDRIDRSDEPGSKASQQVTSELHALRGCLFRLIYKTLYNYNILHLMPILSHSVSMCF